MLGRLRSTALRPGSLKLPIPPLYISLQGVVLDRFHAAYQETLENQNAWPEFSDRLSHLGSLREYPLIGATAQREYLSHSTEYLTNPDHSLQETLFNQENLRWLRNHPGPITLLSWLPPLEKPLTPGERNTLIRWRDRWEKAWFQYSQSYSSSYDSSGDSSHDPSYDPKYNSSSVPTIHWLDHPLTPEPEGILITDSEELMLEYTPYFSRRIGVFGFGYGYPFSEEEWYEIQMAGEFGDPTMSRLWMQQQIRLREAGATELISRLIDFRIDGL